MFALLAPPALLGAAAHASASASESASTPAPTRIVSLNPCLDAILVELVPAQRIAALSHYARDPVRSSIAPLAAHMPITYETAEEVVALRPDLVLMSSHSAVPTRNALRRVGIRFELFEVPLSIAESLAQIRRVAAVVGNESEGERLVSRIEQAVQASRQPAGAPRLTVVMYEPGGLTAGAHTVTDELMQIAGMDNLAARYGIKQHQSLPLELLLAKPPDLLLTGEPTAAPMLSGRIVQHRALRALPAVRQDFHARFMYCSGPQIIEEAAALVAARDKVTAHLLSRSAP